MKKLLLLLICVPMIGFGQCVSGDCENGSGTYIYPSGDKYEGEWKDNKFQGKGSLSWSDGAKYVGEFNLGQRDGKGTFTLPSGDKYIGEYKHNKKNGSGTYIYASGDKYVGEWKNNKVAGEGIKTYANGDKYEGEWKDDMMHGRGVYTFSSDDIEKKLRKVRQWSSNSDHLFVDVPEYSGLDKLTYKKYEGEFENGKFDDNDGVLTFEEGIIWTGMFKRGAFQMGCISGDCENGFGVYLLLWVDLYVGEFKDGERHGKGTYTWGPVSEENFEPGYKHLASVGSQYVGDWENNRRHGVGVYTSNDGSKYEGEYRNHQKNGQGTYTYASGNKYVGEYKDDKRNGQGAYTWASGAKYEGEWKNGNRNGNGIYVSAEVDYEGIGAILSSEIDSNYVVITKVYKGFPSEKAGLFEGDKILEANGETAKGKTTQELSSILKGPANTEINILIERNGNNITFRFNREKVKLPSYKYTGEWKDGKWHGQGVYISSFVEKRQGLFEEGKFISGECWDEYGNEIECE